MLRLGAFAIEYKDTRLHFGPADLPLRAAIDIRTDLGINVSLGGGLNRFSLDLQLVSIGVAWDWSSVYTGADRREYGPASGRYGSGSNSGGTPVSSRILFSVAPTAG